MASIDDSLREQSKVLLRKLKDRQSDFQDVINTSTMTNKSIPSTKSPARIPYTRTNKPQQKTPIRKLNPSPKRERKKVKDSRKDRRLGSTGKVPSPSEKKLNGSLEKSVPERQAKEGRSRLHTKLAKSKGEKERANLDDKRKGSPEMDKENFADHHEKASLENKYIDTDEAVPRAWDIQPEYPSTTAFDTDPGLARSTNVPLFPEYQRSADVAPELSRLSSLRPEAELTREYGMGPPVMSRSAEILSDVPTASHMILDYSSSNSNPAYLRSSNRGYELPRSGNERPDVLRPILVDARPEIPRSTNVHAAERPRSRDMPSEVPRSSANDNIRSELDDLRNKFSGEYLDHLKTLRSNYEDDKENVKSGPATPNTVRRRRIIDRNVKVTGTHDLNASELMRECEEDYQRLNYNYSEFEDKDLKFLEARLGKEHGGRIGRETRDSEPVRDTDPQRPQDGTNMSGSVDNPANNRKIAKYIRDSRKPKSILLSNKHSRAGSANTSRVSFRSPRRDSPTRNNSTSYSMDSYTRDQQKLLGYDWIAALIDNDPVNVNMSETYFDELKEFRMLNRDECVNDVYAENAQQLWEHPEREPLPVREALEETKVKPYMVNNRLFAQPIKKDLFPDYTGPGPSQVPEREPTYDEPRFVRVSIPRSTLDTSSRVKPHRRNSFDASDSMALSKHCMRGYNSSQPATVPTSANIALRDSTKGIKSSMKTTLDDAEKLAANYPYHWDPKEQSICRPLPRATFRPEEMYPDSQWPNSRTAILSRTADNATNLNRTTAAYNATTTNMSGNFNNNSSVSGYDPGSSKDLQRATDNLLDSTYSLMYEMKRLKNDRSDDPSRV